MEEILNPKHEIRNNIKIQMFKLLKPEAACVLEHVYADLHTFFGIVPKFVGNFRGTFMYLKPGLLSGLPLYKQIITVQN